MRSHLGGDAIDEGVIPRGQAHEARRFVGRHPHE